MASDYPVVFDIQRPQKFERVQVALRVLVIIVLSILAGAVGWIFGLSYLVFPILAAIFISQKDSQRFLEEDGPRLTRWIRWILALYSYLALLTDRLPTEKPEETLKYEVKAEGSPSVGSALLRIIYAIPSALVLGLLGIVGAVVWVIAVVMVLIQENYPEGLYNFQLGLMRWQARLFAYQASLVQTYPPFALDTGPLPSTAGPETQVGGSP